MESAISLFNLNILILLARVCTERAIFVLGGREGVQAIRSLPSSYVNVPQVAFDSKYMIAGVGGSLPDNNSFRSTGQCMAAEYEWLENSQKLITKQIRQY